MVAELESMSAANGDVILCPSSFSCPSSSSFHHHSSPDDKWSLLECLTTTTSPEWTKSCLCNFSPARLCVIKLPNSWPSPPVLLDCIHGSFPISRYLIANLRGKQNAQTLQGSIAYYRCMQTWEKFIVVMVQWSAANQSVAGRSIQLEAAKRKMSQPCLAAFFFARHAAFSASTSQALRTQQNWIKLVPLPC